MGKFHLPMPVETEIEAAEAVRAQRVGAALEHHHRGTIVLHRARDNRLEEAVKTLVVHTLAQRHIDGEIAAVALPDIVHVAGAGEKVAAVAVERDRHHTIGEIECLLDAVAVVDVDIDVENASVVLE